MLHQKEELSVHDRCVLRGDQVIVPPAGHSVVLEVLHDGHPGVTKMKQLARSIVWWPGIDKDLENKVRQCKQCVLAQKSPAQSNNDSPWIPGTVAAKLGELTYQVQFDDGRMVRRHIDQIHPRHLEIPVPSQEEFIIPNEASFLLDNTTRQPTTVK